MIDPNKPPPKGKSVYKKGSGVSTPPANVSLPFWMQTEPQVKTKKEEMYDSNRDGKLQKAEVKIFLRDVIDEANQKGGYQIDSPILKEYDKSGDNIISKYEAQEISKVVR